MGLCLFVYILGQRYLCFCLRQSGLGFVNTIALFRSYRIATTFAINDGVNSSTQPVKPVVLPRCEWGYVRVTGINLLSDWVAIRFVSKRCWIRVWIQDFPIAISPGRVSFVTSSESWFIPWISNALKSMDTGLCRVRRGDYDTAGTRVPMIRFDF